MKHELPKLPYDFAALEPHISSRTLEFHYGKHHQAYVNNLNNLLPGSKFENADLETIVREADGGIFNNGAQVWNHTFYFMQFSPTPSTSPTGKLEEAINKTFGSLLAFKEQFAKAGATLFGSGWAWLVVNKEGNLEIVQESNAGNPMSPNCIGTCSSFLSVTCINNVNTIYATVLIVIKVCKVYIFICKINCFFNKCAGIIVVIV